MPVRVPDVTDADLYSYARDTLVLMDAGIPYEDVTRMLPRLRAAYLSALNDLKSDVAEDIGGDLVVGTAN